MDADLQAEFAEMHRHCDAGGATSRKSSAFDALIEDLAAASDRLARRAPTMAKAVPAAPVVPMRDVLGELATMAKAASADAQVAARRAAADRVARREAFRAKFAEADQVLKAMIAGGRMTAEQVAVAEVRMGQFARGLR